MPRTISAIFLLLLLVTSVASAQKPFVYEFLRNDVSARAAAMGGTFLTVTNDPAGMYYNPASLNSVEGMQASFTFFKHLLDINSGSATFATGLDDIGVVGAGVTYTSYGAFERTDRLGRALGEFGSSDIALLVGWGGELGENFSAGLNAKGIFSSIDDRSSAALALDGGILYRDTASRLQAGLSILNLGSQISTYGEESEELPVDLKVGISHELRGLPLLIALNFHRLLDETDDALARLGSFSVGGEFTISKPLRLRFGYNNRIREVVAFGQSKGLGGLSGGIGILVSDYRFDYAFNSLSRVGALHRISVNASF